MARFCGNRALYMTSGPGFRTACALHMIIELAFAVGYEP